MRWIEIRHGEADAHFAAIEAEELGGRLAVRRVPLAPGSALHGTPLLLAAWLAAGAARMDGAPVLPGDLALLAPRAALVAGPAGATAWVLAVAAPAPARSRLVAAGAGEARLMAGDLYTLKLAAEETAGALGLLHFAVPPGGGPIPHVHHREEEIFIVLRGRISLYADGLRPLAEPGDVVCLPRGLPHGFHNLTDEPAEMLCLLTPGGGERFFLEAGRKPAPGEAPHPDPGERARIMAIAARHGVELRPDVAEPYLPPPAF